MIANKKQDKIKTFKDLEPLKFNEKSEDIGQQIKDLENIVKKDFGQEGKKNSEYISFTQLRSLYDKIKQCNEANELAILYPKIVYMAARQSKNEGKELVMQIARFIEHLDNALDRRTRYEEKNENIRQHHETHQNLHRVGNKARELPRCQTEGGIVARSDDFVRTKPSDQRRAQKDAEIH